MTNEKILIKIDNEVIELSGKEKEDFLADKKNILEHESKIKAEAEAKAAAKAAVLAQLGITEEQARLLLS